MSGMYQNGECTASSCRRLATLEIIMEVFFDGDWYHKPYSFLDKVGYCDDDFGFFYRKFREPNERPHQEIVRVDVVDTPVQIW